MALMKDSEPERAREREDDPKANRESVVLEFGIMYDSELSSSMPVGEEKLGEGEAAGDTLRSAVLSRRALTACSPEAGVEEAEGAALPGTSAVSANCWIEEA
jgi:hypothetical protein